MKILVDMNLSPQWVPFLEQNGYEVQHWSVVGSPNDPDEIIFHWAQENHSVIFTNDLDFGTILALTKGYSPSVIQARTDTLLPENIGSTVLAVLHQFEIELTHGALITFDLKRAKARMLPLR